MLVLIKKKRSGATKQHHPYDSFSPSESSSEEDEQLELEDGSEEEEESSTMSKKEHPIPSIDLWIPTGTDTQGAIREIYQFKYLLPTAKAGAGSSCSDIPGAGCDSDKAADESCELNTVLRGLANAYATDMVVRDPAEVIAKVSWDGSLDQKLEGKCTCCTKGRM